MKRKSQYLGTGFVPQQKPALAYRQALADQNSAPQADEGTLEYAGLRDNAARQPEGN